MNLPKRKKRPVVITLTSMIDMFTILIIYLLSQSSAKAIAHLSTIRSELPIEAASDTPPPDVKEPPLNLSVFITKEGFLVSASAAINSGGKGTTVSELSYQIPLLADKNYDFESLNQSLIGIKEKHPQENQVIITADTDVIYETVVHTMDATREYNDPAEAGKFKALFPQPTIAAGVL